MIVLENIRKEFGATVALRDFSCAFPSGTITALIGPSGCGKSTALRIIAGLTASDTGHVKVNGMDLAPGTVREIRRLMGYVIQEGGLFPHMSCFDNVSLLAVQDGWDRQRISNRINELSDLVRLEPTHLQSFPWQLSGGQRQRVSIMRSLMHDPDILLLDEPLGALDSIVRAELQRDLKKIFLQLDKTVILITHDLAEAAYFSDSLVLLRDGEIEQSGSLRDLARNPASPFVTQFVQAQGDSATAFLEATS